MRARSRKSPVLIAAALLALAPAGAGAKAPKKKPKPVTIVTATATGSTSLDETPVTATATCPPKTVAIGGGYAGIPFPNERTVFPLESRRVGSTQWRATALVSTSGQPQELTTEVYCAKLRGTVVEGNGTSILPGPHYAVGTAAAACPSKSRLLSGGFQLVGATTAASLGFVSRSSAAGNGWAVSVLRAVNAGPEALVASAAYCLKPAKKKKGKKRPRRADPKGVIEMATSGMLGSDTNDSFAFPAQLACPAGRQAISGGFSAAPTTDGSFGPTFFESRRSGATWRIGVQQVASAEGPVSAFQYCG